MNEVMRRRHTATTEDETNMALMWGLFLPQALLWRPPARGGRGGRQQTDRRFNCLVRRDWGTLIDSPVTD